MTHPSSTSASAPEIVEPPMRTPDGVPIIALDIPIMFEDEGQEEMGETDIHWRCCEITRNGIRLHLRNQPLMRVFSDLNVYYTAINRNAYVSPDTCVVEHNPPLPVDVTSYRIDDDHPAPLLTLEVLSRRSAQQQDLHDKFRIYAELGVREYILVDVSGTFMAERLQLHRLNHDDGTWTNHRDEDGAVTSALGFRILINDDGMICVTNAETGKRYTRPEEIGDLEDAMEQAKKEILKEKEKAAKERERARKEREKAVKERERADKVKDENRELKERLRKMEQLLKKSDGEDS